MDLGDYTMVKERRNKERKGTRNEEHRTRNKLERKLYED
jgi:hypothetical protein